MIGKGAGVSLFDDPSHVIFRIGLQPNRVTGIQQTLKRLRIGNETAAGGEHKLLVRGEDFIESPPFHAAKAALPVEIEDCAERRTAGLLNEPVKLEKGVLKFLRKQRADGGFARAAQPKKRDAPAAAAGSLGTEMLPEPAFGLRQFWRGQG